MGLLLFLSLGTGVLPAQRAYQRYWEEQFQKMTPAPIVEDERPPRDPATEEYLFKDERALVMPVTVFPGLADATAGNPASQLAFESFASGVFAFEQGNPTSALRHYDEAVRKDPGNIHLKLRLAQTTMMLNDLSRAETLLQEILQVDGQNLRALLFMGEISALRQQYERSKEWYQKALAAKPRNIQALQALMQIAYGVDRDLEATRDYSQRILHINGRELNAMLYNAEASAQLGDASAAADLYQRLIRFRPDLLPRMTETARRLARAGRREDALTLYERAMLIAPEQREIRQNWESMLRQASGEDAVAEAYKRLAAESRRDLRVYEMQADYLRRTARWDDLERLRNDMLGIEAEHVASLLDLAEIAMRRGDSDAGMAFFQRAIAADSASAETWRLVGEALVKQGRLEDARLHLTRATELGPEDPNALQSLALLELQLGNHNRAEELLRLALEKSPVNPVLLRQLANIYIARNDMTRAAELLQQVISANRADIDAWISLATIYLEQNNGNGLDILESQATEFLKDLPEFNVRYGEVAQRYGQYDRSRRAVDKALRIIPSDLGARLMQARTYMLMDQPDAAVAVIEEMGPLVQGRPAALLLQRSALASVLSDARRHARAEEILAELVRENPDSLEFRRELLLSQVRQDKEAAVREGLNDLVRRFAADKPLDAQLVRAEILREQGSPARAVSILRQLAEENPGNLQVAFDLAMAASDAGDVATAEKYYLKVIEAGNTRENIHYENAANNLGYTLAQNTDRIEDAKKYVQMALDVNPNAAYILDSMGWVYYRLGDYGKAREYLEKAARFSGRDAEILTNLGQLYEKIGEKDLARTAYDRALKLDPKSRIARERIEAMAPGAAGPASPKVE